MTDWPTTQETIALLQQPEPAPCTLREIQWRKWRDENPVAVRYLIGYALQMHAHCSRISADMVFHRLRWDTRLALIKQNVTNDLSVRVNDHHTAYFARDLARWYPHLAEAIEMRPLKSEQVAA